METILEIKNLKKYFDTPNGTLHAVDDVSFTLRRGETLGLVGESGCGKSTLGRTILRLIEPTAGEVLFRGEDITKLKKREMTAMRRKMQIIFQDPSSTLNPRMTVGQCIAEPMFVNKIAKGKALKEKVKYYMTLVNLDHRFYNSFPHELSGGQRQRVGIARALSLEPELIICDEPVSSLDVSVQAQILNLLQDLQEQLGLTYIFITHDLSVVKHLSTRIAVMYLGQLVEMCDAEELFENTLHPYTKALLGSILVPSLSAREANREIIKGEIVSPINPKPGCRFAMRCNHVADHCKDVPYSFIDTGKGHFVSCPKR
ncbi:MAG: ABC transporter ATP-binding protein [Oscillospiraceae bacterium]|nr:ABC transporter ATP-binding protein [Oscillospiraceae bacterium]